MASLMNKARKPKFEVHLTIYDLNNVPLVTGVSQIKWRIPGSLHAEHHGRTPKSPIANHRVEYNYGHVIPVRIGIDKNNNLAECPLEFEVLQEFSNSTSAAVAGVVGGGVEKTTLGIVKVNLSEYVEESDALLRDVSRRASYTGSDRDRPLTAATGHSRRRSSLSLGGQTIGGESFLSKSTASSYNTTSTGNTLQEELTLDANPKPAPDVEEGVIRRYLMQESKINSTLKLGILMIQIDGERNYVAPPLRTAPVFGGIAGLMAGAQGEPLEPTTDSPPGDALGASAHNTDPSIAGKSRDIYEVQDMYRRALAASWASQPGELPADECIEDIFSGGDGFRTGSSSKNARAKAALLPGHHQPQPTSTTTGSGKSAKFTPSTKSPDSAGSDDDMLGTLRPRDLARLKHHFHHATSHFHHSSTDREPREPRERSRERTTTAFPAFKDPVSPETTSHYQPSSNPGGLQFLHQQHSHRRDLKDDRDSLGVNGGETGRNRSDSLASLATTLGSSDRGRRGDAGFKKPREVEEFDVRDDLVAWTMPGVVS